MKKPVIQKTLTVTVLNAHVRGWLKDFTLRWPGKLQVRDMDAAVAWYISNRMYDDKVPGDIRVVSYQYETKTYTLDAHQFEMMADAMVTDVDEDDDPLGTVDITTTDEKEL